MPLLGCCPHVCKSLLGELTHLQDCTEMNAGMDLREPGLPDISSTMHFPGILLLEPAAFSIS